MVYTRWGKSSCPSTPGTELVNAGRTGGTQLEHCGGGANQLCMPLDPQYSNYKPGVQGSSYMYGAEYERPPIVSSKHNHDATCAVCYVSSRETVLMVPAKHTHAQICIHTLYTFRLLFVWKLTMGMKIFEVSEREDSVSGLVDIHH